MAKEESTIIEARLSKITKDKKQVTVRIPSVIVLDFLIDPKKDGFLWKIEEENGAIFLRGELIKNIKWKNGKKD